MSDGIKIRVRVSRLWYHQSSYSRSENNAIEMIFVDEEGHRIHAIIMKRHISHFEGTLVEGHVYYISNFGVTENTARFKMVAHDHKISFYRATKVVEFTGDFSGPIYGLEFTDYTNVLNFKVDADLALAHAQITNCFYGTRILLDAEMSDVETFRIAYLARNSVPNGSFKVVDLSQKALNSIIEEFVIKSPKKNAAEMRETRTLGKYVIVGMIVAIHLEPTWSYLACPKCNSAVKDDNDGPDLGLIGSKGKSIGVWKCRKCDVRGVDAVRRFRVEVRVQDPTGSVPLILFNRDVSKIVKKTTAEIYAQMPVGEEDDSIPAEL